MSQINAEMTDDDLFLESELRRHVSVLFGPVSENVEWLCDVKEAVSETIILCNESLRSQGRVVENKFMNVGSKPSTVVDLLKNDYEFLCANPKFEILRSLAQQMHFYEIDKASPHAGIVTIEVKGTQLFAISFNSPMISLINSAFSKIFILTHDYVHAGCLSVHDEKMCGEAYNDTQLLLGLFRDIEDLFVNEEPYVSIYPPHLASPYNYCERVEGARRFILGHEVAHVFQDGSTFDIEIDLNNFLNSLDSEKKDSWKRELWCDAFSLDLIMERRDDPILTGEDLYEMENSLVGILTYFTLLDIIDCSLMNLTPPTHPPAWIRREFLRNRIKRHKIYTENRSMPKVLTTNWRRLRSFREFAGGTLGPARFKGIWSRSIFRTSLTPFGQRALKTLSTEALDKRYAASFDDDSFYINQRIF